MQSYGFSWSAECHESGPEWRGPYAPACPIISGATHVFYFESYTPSTVSTECANMKLRCTSLHNKDSWRWFNWLTVHIHSTIAAARRTMYLLSDCHPLIISYGSEIVNVLLNTMWINSWQIELTKNCGLMQGIVAVKLMRKSRTRPSTRLHTCWTPYR